MTREEVVQAALTVERWCNENCNDSSEPCDCPFCNSDGKLWGQICRVSGLPEHWKLEEWLRTRGLKHDD